MVIMKEVFKKVDEYNAFKLNEYNDIFEIVGGSSDGDKFYMTWTIVTEYDKENNASVPAKKEDGKYRYLPNKIILGTRTEAIDNLRWLLSQLDGDINETGEPSATDTSKDDVPF